MKTATNDRFDGKKAREAGGFSLVATLALVILLAVIAVGLLSLSSVALRTGSAGEAEAKARANARMAMMLALGELQRTTGLDQRVTATASILDTNNNYANPNWTGVWRSDGLKTDPVPAAKGIIYRDETRGAVAPAWKDQRGVARGGRYQRATQVLGWLVSQPESATALNPAVALDESKRVALVDEGSSLPAAAGDPAERHKVFAPLVKVDMQDGMDGAYAWAVLDSGVKARYNLSNPTQGPAAANRWRSAARTGIPYARNDASSPGVYPNYETTDADDINKVATRKSIRLIEGTAASEYADIKTRFHDVTVGTHSVLADTQSGGLKRDLSQFLQTGSAPALGSRAEISNQTPMFDAKGLRLLSPTWGLLRSWYQKAETLTDTETAAIAPNSGTLAPGAIELWYKGTRSLQSTGPAVKQRTTLGMHPVVVDAGVSYGASLVRLNDAASSPDKKWYRLRIHYSPRVVLYNPYDVKLQAADYAISIEMPHQFRCKLQIGSTERDVGMNLNGQLASVCRVSGANVPHCPVFSMSNVSLEPGEALLFTANGSRYPNRSIPWPQASDVGLTAIGGAFALSCNNPLPLIDSIYFTCERDDAKLEMTDAEAQTAAYQILADKDGDGDGGWKTFMHMFSLVKGNKGPGSVAAMRTGGTGFESLQYFNQTEDGASGSDAPWVPGGVLPGSVSARLLETSSSQFRYPYERSKWGHRWVWIDDTAANATYRIGNYNTPFLDYNQLTSHNIASNWNVRGPIENCLRSSSAGGRYTHGPFIDDPILWDWADPMFSPVSVKGKNRVSPFGLPGRSGGAVFPLLSVPRGADDVVSLAALQHVPLSVFPWHPSFAVGNSLADPRTARDKSTNYMAPQDWGIVGTGVGMHTKKDQGRFRMSHLDAALDSEAFVYDLSYEANCALWDRYFLSTVPQRGAWTLDTPLANPRMVRNPDAENPGVDQARDHHRAATQLMLAGGFNVNSTSVPAWAAVFASMSENPEMEIALGDGTKARANHVFSHLLRPAGSLYSASGAPDPYNEATWTGYRALTNEQIYELAREMVVEVKRRGPFISLADFINRRLVEPPTTSGAETDFTRTGLKGALQAALDRTSINQAFLNAYKINKTNEYAMASPSGEQIQYGTNYPRLEFPLLNGSAMFGLKPDHNHWADSKLVNTPTFLTQADVLQKIGQTLTARSDTFRIRAYGDCREAGTGGKILAKAWCEVVVQRTPRPLYPEATDTSGLDPDPKKPLGRYGRVYRVVSFRWLSPKEV